MPRIFGIPFGAGIAGPDSFSYDELQHDDEIRLLTIPPKKVRGTGRLAVDLDHVRLSASPLYSAISWMWGPPDQRDSLVLNGRKIPVQRNLRRIIEQIQEDEQSRRVWIDAICINQANLDERSQQVQMMGRIYNSANYVLACLTAKRTDRIGLQEDAKKLYTVLRDSESQPLIKTEDYPFFFGNQYFLRRWIIQEISQAKVAHFCCEGYQFPMGRLGDAIQNVPAGKNRASALQGDHQVMAARRAVQLCQIQAGPRTISMPLEELLYEHEHAQCKEFQDKIYALLSLTTHAQRELGVDYTIDREQLMLSVLYVCAAHENLSPFRVLSYMIFLYQHLVADNEKLKDIIFGARTPNNQYNLTIRGIVRGHVDQLQCSTDIEAAAVNIRKNLPILRSRHPVALMTSYQITRGTSVAEHWLLVDNQSSATIANSSAEIVSGADQCLFTFRSHASADDPAANPLTVGFASAPVALGDQIWQFERTPLAIVARRTRRGYTLVGRAFLLRTPKPQARWPPKKIEQELRWVKSGVTHGHHTPFISLGWRELHEVASWVNFDPSL